MRTGVNIGGSESMSLKGALLVYEGRHGSFVAWHEAKFPTEGGAPYLGEAEPLTTEFLRELGAGLGSHLAPEVLPPNVLVRTPEMLMWWRRARQQHTMFFAENSDAGKELNGKRYPHPPLVFKAAGNELWVRALERDERPSADTKLKVAPYWNTNDAEGRVCIGTMRTPDVDGVGGIEPWERGFFQSEFTHPYGAARLTSFPGGFLSLWRNLAGSKKPFPVNYLTDARQTLREFVEQR
jgi:PRTRC genetic system protein B